MDWRWCSERRTRYPVVLPEYRDRDAPINPYVFIDELSDQLEADDVVVLANGAACVTALQALRLKRGQRLIVNSGTAGMGYDLPAAIGARVRSPRTVRRAGGACVCLAGDGSIQMNMQELETLVHHELPVKIFVFNNGGYLSIRLTQDNLFGGARFGESSATGVGLPDMRGRRRRLRHAAHAGRQPRRTCRWRSRARSRRTDLRFWMWSWTPSRDSRQR